ncbi:MAG: hypothetical protein JST00_29800 [Deltaproteobacteria bacterium]|nr:hypothetical protein [Deltaproteobacteria bacterium]
MQRRHDSGIELYVSRETRTLRALEHLHTVFDGILAARDPELLGLGYAVRTLWLSVVYDLAEHEEERHVWLDPESDDVREDLREVSLSRITARAMKLYDAFIVPVLDFGLDAPRPHQDVRAAVERVLDALDPSLADAPTEEVDTLDLRSVG